MWDKSFKDLDRVYIPIGPKGEWYKLLGQTEEECKILMVSIVYPRVIKDMKQDPNPWETMEKHGFWIKEMPLLQATDESKIPYPGKRVKT